MLRARRLPRSAFGQDKFDTLTRFCLDCDVRFACDEAVRRTTVSSRLAADRVRPLPLPRLETLSRRVEAPMATVGGLLAADQAPPELHAVVRNQFRDAAATHLRLQQQPQWKHLPRVPLERSRPARNRGRRYRAPVPSVPRISQFGQFVRRQRQVARPQSAQAGQVQVVPPTPLPPAAYAPTGAPFRCDGRLCGLRTFSASRYSCSFYGRRAGFASGLQLVQFLRFLGHHQPDLDQVQRLMKPSLMRIPPARMTASLSGTAQWCSSRTSAAVRSYSGCPRAHPSPPPR